MPGSSLIWSETVHIREAIQRLIRKREIVSLQIKELPGIPFYATDETLALTAPLTTRRLRILSPFDNLVIRRKRLLQLFDFDYQLECYTPPAKRRHGYFCLPVLWGDRFIARIDAKADRTTGKLIVQKWFVESSRLAPDAHKQLQTELRRFAAFNQCNDVQLPRPQRA